LESGRTRLSSITSVEADTLGEEAKRARSEIGDGENEAGNERENDGGSGEPLVGLGVVVDVRGGDVLDFLPC
jgi:hypothetical protein